MIEEMTDGGENGRANMNWRRTLRRVAGEVLRAGGKRVSCLLTVDIPHVDDQVDFADLDLESMLMRKVEYLVYYYY